jgi:hypothetical protein
LVNDLKAEAVGFDMLTGEQKEKLHRLYRTKDAYRALFDWAEKRGINARVTTVTTVAEHTGLNTSHAIDLMETIAETGIADFHRGAGGKVSELVWKDDVREIGKAAREGLFPR